jgi:FimV-like protein
VKFELAMVYLDSGDLERAIPILREVIAAEPQNSNARFQLGSALAKKDDCAGAIPLLETATESDRKYYVLAGCLKKLGREAEAAAALAKVRELRGGADARMQAKYHAGIAHQYVEAGKLDEAIAEYRAALKLNKDLSIAIDLAVTLLKQGKADEVVSLLGHETDPLARYQVALAYTKLGRLAESRAALESITNANPKFVEAWYQLGVVTLTTGKVADAERAFRTAVDLRPDEPVFRLAWAEALKKLGRMEEAERQIELSKQAPR